MSEAIDLLKAIDAKLGTLVAILRPKNEQAASEADLDGPYGDPVVRFDPRDWTGEPFKGCKFSQTTSAFLEMLANAYDYFAEKNARENKLDNKGRPQATWDRKNAALARGWAERLRTQPASSPNQEEITW